MQKSVDYRVTLRSSVQLDEIDGFLDRYKRSLKQKVAEIDEITSEVMSPDQSSGIEQRVRIAGTITFKDGLEPDVSALCRAGDESFEGDFDLRPMFELDTTDKDSTSAGVLCRGCRSLIGEVPGYIGLIASGNQAALRQRFRDVAMNHLRNAHPNLDPSSIAFL